MRKTFLTLSLYVFFASTSSAQQHEAFNQDKDIKEIQGLTIRLRPAPGNTYLYEIYKGNTPVVFQNNNPFNESFRGFVSKEDAFKTAMWAIKEYKKGGTMPNKASMQVARQLNIQVSTSPKP